MNHVPGKNDQGIPVDFLTFVCPFCYKHFDRDGEKGLPEATLEDSSDSLDAATAAGVTKTQPTVKFSPDPDSSPKKEVQTNLDQNRGLAAPIHIKLNKALCSHIAEHLLRLALITIRFDFGGKTPLVDQIEFDSGISPETLKPGSVTSTFRLMQGETPISGDWPISDPGPRASIAPEDQSNNDFGIELEEGSVLVASDIEPSASQATESQHNDGQHVKHGATSSDDSWVTDPKFDVSTGLDSQTETAKWQSSERDAFISLGDQLLQEFVVSKFDHRRPAFLPEGTIESLITRWSIAAELQDDDEKISHFPETDLVNFVEDQAKKTFAITVCCGISGTDLRTTMKFFKTVGFNDRHLPIKKPQPPRRDQLGWNFPFPFDGMAKEKRLRRIWNVSGVTNFFSQQWCFLAPVFSAARFQYHLSPDCIFPFTWVNNIVKGGMFSQIYEVEIHPRHHEQPVLTVDGLSAHVAIKEILVNGQSSHESEKNYDHERDVLSEITDLRHNHIIQRIAAITRAEQRYLMFEWADGGNLREFWRKERNHLLTPDLVKQIITQIYGLADALDALHNYEGGGNYRHGDLKPENILRFRDKTFVGILKIADMGLAKRHIYATASRMNATTTRYGTVRYEPPEVATNRLDKARSRRYDIWSMGCIILEFIIWLLYGYEALEEFDHSLNTSGFDCSFFKVKDVDGARVAQVHPIVEQWMNSIAVDWQCGTSTAIGDLLKLVRNRLLVVPLLIQAPTVNLDDPQPTIFVTGASQSTPEVGLYRADANVMKSELEKILQKANCNQVYLLRAQTRVGSRGPVLVVPKSQSSELRLLVPGERPREDN
ncbi:protein kinase [Colletotrichum tamarilloi]|uniref:Protein kinase n=1 Tax=Colletotrichum tamarilloi TaxID=1209934 RepID=A0ABQ9R6R1_9PEZI|nr:protein kinase [Colletotrichum tamarilloi]KAK1496615.1 protein kinase [Colletotrichum tamarilloi]